MMRRAAFWCATAIVVACTTRPVATNAPTTKAVVQIPLTQTRVTKVDLVVAIDNSASMGDKQLLLKDAVPDLIRRLLTPLCIDPDNPSVAFGPSQDGACAKGDLEFAPILDLHLGIVSSSLGGVGSDACTPSSVDTTFDWHLDDRGHLVARDGPPEGYLAWKAGDDTEAMIGKFQKLVASVGEYGCGYEAQEESWYRFLVQPDPYDTIDTSSGLAKLVGVDEDLLKQRRAFLRPDSLVAIIQITDENESTVDPRSLSGGGYELEMRPEGAAPRATTPCASDPNAQACSSCFWNSNASLPECLKDRHVDPADDALGIRFFHMKQRFGVDPMYAPERYSRGLGLDQTLEAPDRDGKACMNPLFANALPAGAKDELCKLPRGPRSPNLVFYAAITGVPGDLVPPSGDLGPDDWRKLLGDDPLRYDFGGVDPRMRESVAVRPGVPADRDTAGKDLQYACTFDLAAPKKCDPKDPACDCTTDGGGPLCDPADPHSQVRAKAYPGVRHLALAKALGKNGMVASICPDDAKDPAPTNLRYGYRAAMRAIASRLGAILSAQCLPRPPKAQPDGRAPCLVLEVMTGDPGDDTSACTKPGLVPADPDVLKNFRDARKNEGIDLMKTPVCEKTQLLEPPGQACRDDARAGWCYATGAEALRATRQKCAEAIVFSKSGEPDSGHTVYLQCIEQAD
jgi:hypothetical protein